MGKDKQEEHAPQRGPEPKEPAVQPKPADPSAGEPQARRGVGRQRSTDDSFTGRAAQFAVMAELMRLRCNAAVPEIDLGTDVFAFRDDRAEVVRIQVKACTTPREYVDGSGYSAKFGLPMKQFHRLDDRPPLYYALAVLRGERWVDFLIVSRKRLQTYYNGKNRFGYHNRASGDLEITVEFRQEVKCSGQDLTDCRNAWTLLPPLQPPPDLETGVEGRSPGEAGGAVNPPTGPDQA